MKAGDRIVFIRPTWTDSGRAVVGSEGRIVDPGTGSAIVAIRAGKIEVEVVVPVDSFRIADEFREGEALPSFDGTLPSKIEPHVLILLRSSDLTVVAETADYFIYSQGSMEPGLFGISYSLMAATFSGDQIRLANAEFRRPTNGACVVNLGSTSGTSDPMVLRAKADILSRMADILAKELAR